jgi:hypothetical protein
MGDRMAERKGLCLHCGKPIWKPDSSEFAIHTKGGHTGKMRCDPKDSGQPYGLEATFLDVGVDTP